MKGDAKPTSDSLYVAGRWLQRGGGFITLEKDKEA
jgi:hypothetical protein